MVTISADTALSVNYKPITEGFPIVQTGTLAGTLQAALSGGQPTADFFNQLNETANFWSAIASGALSFVDAVDPNGQPVVVASSGNVDMRMAATWSGATDTTEPLGMMVIELANTQMGLVQVMASEIWLAAPPPQGAVGEDLFNALRPTLYSSFGATIQSIAAQLAQMAATKDPSINPQTVIVEILTAASQKAISAAGSLAAWGLKTLFVGFNDLAFSVGVMAPLLAVPLIFEYLAHAMYLSVLVINNTGIDFTLSLAAQPHGQSSVNWPMSTLPAVAQASFPLGEGGQSALLQTALSQYINSNTWGAIGIVLQTNAGNGDPASEVISVPWAGENTIWVGAPSASPDQTWSDHEGVNGRLTYTAARSGYTANVAISALSGQTADTYWYGVLIVLS